ncbi:MAG: L,D-transpeptidase family protein [Candidatus Eremiobacteraeota bacterium]|nr:L,D-transpeptidase family protein [Candidatus Eremiobacteraeota bacterium]
MRTPMRSLYSLAVLLALLLSGPVTARAEEAPFLPMAGTIKKHTVAPGENLYTIGLKYHVAIDHLMMANGISTLEVAPGTVLTVPSMRIVPAYLDNGIVLNLPERMLYLFENRKLAGWFPVAIGAPGKWKTPVGDVKIANKAKNPTWLPPEWADKEDPVAPGPDNPLGDRWIGLTIPGYGIHATNVPLTVGMATSHGCLRMNPRDVHELYDRVKEGMAVKIIYEPLLLGQHPETGIIYLSCYPDVYGTVPDMKEALEARLRKFELEGMVDHAPAQAALASKKGLPVPLLGIDVALRINEQPLRLSLPLVMREGKIYCTSDVLGPLGGQIEADEARGVYQITRNDRKFELPLRSEGASEGRAVLAWKGRTLLPLREVVEGLGLLSIYDPAARTISITGATPRAPKRPSSREQDSARDYEERVRRVEERF